MASNDTAERLGTLGKLREKFDGRDYENHPGLWDDLWLKKDFLPWDRNCPSPALIDALDDKTKPFNSPFKTDGSRKRALVPGCGRGYDVLLLASLGYDAVGLEISENAYQDAMAFAKSTTDFEIKDGSTAFVKGDFFENDWLAAAGTTPTRGFDFIYDYTFLCALPPEARPAWAGRMSDLLAKDSEARLICLEFPLFKDPSTRGPPFGLSSDAYIAHLSHPGEKLPYTPQGYPEPSYYSTEAVEQASKDRALVRVDHWRPERTHEAGQGSDMVSVWQHKE